MSRMTAFLALAAMIAPLSAQAQAPTLRAEFAAPFERTQTVIIDGRMWSCSGNACTSRGDDPRPTVACRKLARKVGAVTRFAAAQAELDAAALAACNQDQK